MDFQACQGFNFLASDPLTITCFRRTAYTYAFENGSRLNLQTRQINKNHLGQQRRLKCYFRVVDTFAGIASRSTIFVALGVQEQLEPPKIDLERFVVYDSL